MSQEQESQRRRAARLREQIKQIVQPEPKPEERREKKKVKTPRDFIHERMRELNQSTETDAQSQDESQGQDRS
jgi:hypothetical protein